MEENIKYLKFTVDETGQDQRICKYLSKHYKHVIPSRQKLHSAFKRQEITIDGQPVEEVRILKKGDVVEIKYDNSIDESEKMNAIPVRVCYEDEHLAIVWKPSGQNVIMFEKAIQFKLALKDAHGNKQKCWSINEIQKAASGLILVAKTQEIKNQLTDLYKNDKIKITMRVLCHGAIPTIDPDQLFKTTHHEKDEEPEPILAHQVLKSLKIVSITPSNNAEFITRLDLDLHTPFSSSNLRRLFFFQSNHPIVGNSQHTRQLKVNDKGLLSALTGLSLTHPVTHQTIALQEPEPTKFASLCDREAKFHQIKQTTKELLPSQKRFCHHLFEITSDCLIPRPSSESLVKASIELRPTRLIDVGTGCGNLLISILLALPEASGVGLDISEEALAVARQNGERLMGDQLGRVDWRVQDMATLDESDPFDLLVCNPPYLDFDQINKKRHQRSVFEKEPSVALFAEEGGYHWYRVLSKVALKVVKQDGFVVLECGKDMMGKVLEIWSDWGKYRVYKDYQGWDRCLVLQRKNKTE